MLPSGRGYSTPTLFDVLKFFIIGNIAIGITTAISDLEPFHPEQLTAADYLFAVLDAIGAGFYVATLGTILQFTKLVKEAPLVPHGLRVL